MTANKTPVTVLQLQATNDDVAVELSSEAIRNLTGYFDVLIQMDFAQKQRNEKGKKDEKADI